MPRGRLFTLVHEYAHLLLHTEGLCDTVTDTRATTPDRRLEARCNAIAAAILMPAAAVLARPEVIAREHARDSWDYDALAAAAAPFGASAEALLRRLLTLGRVEAAFYRCAMVSCTSPASHAATRSSGKSSFREAATGDNSIVSRAQRSTEGSTSAGIETGTWRFCPTSRK